MKDKRVESCVEENPGEWFVELKRGFQLDGAHCFGEDSLKDVRETLKRVTKCRCEECDE